MRAQLAWLASMSLTGCQFVPGSDASAIREAEQVVSAELRDPESAQFQSTKVSGDYVCGEVNGRNAFGGYAGFGRFVVTPAGKAILEPVGTNEDDALARQYFDVIWASCGSS